ncbi:MAG: protein kinase [Dactylosporangium sp.]|nr:protein kinase [Dactylosporangium sp.]NNJ63597.1 protein kinase [Dactylosporangium sp.]
MDKAHDGDDGIQPPVSPPERGEPRQIGKYSILAKVGAGGMGTVFRGRSPDGENVAIKLVHQHLATDTEFRRRLTSEAAAGRRVPAFCSARVLDTGIHNDQPYLVTDYIDGIPLSRLVSAEGALDLPRVHALALGIAAGLAAIHNVELVHRDVKPSNIMLTMGGVRIIDFGIVRALDEAHGCTRTGIAMGSLGWAAPEQLEGTTPAPSMDIFSWGCVVAFAATAAHPFGPGGLNTRAQRMFTAQPLLTDVPEPLRPLVAWSLHREPASRPTAQELLLALISASPPAGASRPKAARAGRPRKVLTALAVAAPLTAALAVGVAGSPTGGDVHPPADRHPTTAPAVSGHPSSDEQQPSERHQQPEGSATADPEKVPPAVGPAAGPAADPAGTADPATSTADSGGGAAETTTANTPSTADECKNDGWKLFTDPSFKNQGDCVSYVETR